MMLASTSEHNDDNGVFDYVSARDSLAVKAMFQDNSEMLGSCNREIAYQRINAILADKSKSFKVMRHNSITVGFIAYHAKNEWWHIQSLVVDANHRKKGYAEQMLQHGIDDICMHEIDKISIYVIATNVAARSLYEKKFKFKYHQSLHDDECIELILDLK